MRIVDHHHTLSTTAPYFILKDLETQQPLVNQPYAIHLADKVIEGKTDELGTTTLMTTVKSEELFVEVLLQDNDKIYFDVTYWGESNPVRIDFSRKRTSGKDQ